jgi:transposase
MSIDEVALSKGELYTILTNKDGKGKKGCLAAIIKGTKASVVGAALRQVPVKTRYAVKEITADLAGTMDWICRENFLNARLTADRFHVQQLVSEGVQEIRIKLRREAIDEENASILEGKKYIPKTYANGDTKKQLLARGRYLLFKSSGKWTKSQEERAAILFQEFPELKKSYELSMCFRGIYETANTKTEAKKRIEQWFEKVRQSKLKSLLSAANSVQSHLGVILNFFDSRETNAGAESFNAKLKGFRSLLRGVSELSFFLFRVEQLWG